LLTCAEKKIGATGAEMRRARRRPELTTSGIVRAGDDLLWLTVYS
jgi:hypothetical protein